MAILPISMSAQSGFCATTWPTPPLTENNYNCYDCANPPQQVVTSGPIDGIYHIPIVFHNYYNADMTGYVSDEQILGVFQTLNEKFSGAPDTHIRFHLAKIDPDGNRSNGITHTIIDKPGVPEPFANNLNSDVDDFVREHQWSNHHYLNVNIVNLLDEFGTGPSQYRGFSTGVNPNFAADAVWLDPNAIYTEFGQNALQPFILTHEVGHYFYLYHPWGSNIQDNDDDACTCGDCVVDTDPMTYILGNPVACVSTTCIGTGNDPLNNYMSYSDECYSQFTSGQADRMRDVSLWAYRYEIWSRENLARTGIICDIPNEVSSVTIPSGQTAIWNSTNANFNDGVYTYHYITGNVAVSPGGVLLISANTSVRFCPNSELIVEPTGRVSLNSEAELTGLGNCLWEGVRVQGDPLASQTTVPLTQGRFIGQPDATIKNARIGIYVGKSIDNIQVGGGIVTLNGVNFKDNTTAISFAPYSSPSNPNRYNISAINDCSFLHNEDAQTYLSAFIKLQNLAGVNIKGCQFLNKQTFINSQNTPTPAPFTGILAINAGFKLTQLGAQRNTFRGLDYGVRTLALSAERAFTVSSSDFENCQIGLYNSGVNLATITGNKFNFGNTIDGALNSFGVYNTGQVNQVAVNQIGVFLDQAVVGVTFQRNEFKRTSFTKPNLLCIGSICKGIGSSNKNVIRDNICTGMDIAHLANGACANGINQLTSEGLHYLCNINTGSKLADFATADYGGPALPVRIRRIQGVPQGENLPTLWAGNTFSANSTGAWFDKDFANHGQINGELGKLNYFYGTTLISQPPVLYSGLKLEFGLPNSTCGTTTTETDPTEVELESIKAAWYDDADAKQVASMEYEAAIDLGDSTLAEQKNLAASYYATEMDVKATAVVKYEMSDTITYSADTLAEWLLKINSVQIDMGAAMVQAEQGNFAAAESVLEGIEGRYGNDLEASDRQDIEEMPQLIDIVRQHSIYNLPETTLADLRRLAQREEGYVPTTARNILTIYGESYIPVFRLPTEIANEIGLPIANHVGVMMPKLAVFPNPATDKVTFAWKDESLGEAIATLFVTDLFGRVVATMSLQNGSESEISVNSLPSGHYIFKLSDEHALISSGKFFVQH